MNHYRNTALERSVKKLLGRLNRFYGYPISTSASIMAQNIQLFGPREGFHKLVSNEQIFYNKAGLLQKILLV